MNYTTSLKAGDQLLMSGQHDVHLVMMLQTQAITEIDLQLQQVLKGA